MRPALLMTILLTTLLAPYGAQAKVYLDINAPSERRVPVAITVPQPMEDGMPVPLIANEVREVLAGDLDFSGVFRILDTVLYLENQEHAGIAPGSFKFDDWELINAEALVKTGYRLRPDGDVELEFHLYDVFQKREISAKRWKGTPAQVRRMAHMFSNEVMERVTGESGIFLSTVLYVQAEGSAKEIYVMDYDGANARRVTRNGSINLSPTWWPDREGFIYTSYKFGEPDLFSLSLKGSETRLTSGLGVDVGADFSPDGRLLAFMRNEDGNPDIYLSDRNGKMLSRLTWLKSVEASPSWSPDGRSIAFVSDRYGTPQIFVMDADGSNAKRLTYDGLYNTSPVWSPKGDRIAFTTQNGGKFGISLINPDTLEVRPLVGDAGNNEDPCWSPDGRFILFTSNRSGSYQLYVVDREGRREQRMTSGGADKTFPAWSSK